MSSISWHFPSYDFCWLRAIDVRVSFCANPYIMYVYNACRRNAFLTTLKKDGQKLAYSKSLTHLCSEITKESVL